MNTLDSWQKKLEERIKEYLDGYTACHDFWHLDRVRENALKIAEAVECDKEVLEAAALLHDVGYREHEDDHEHHYKYSMEIAQKWLPGVGFPKRKIGDVLEVIRLHDNLHWEKGKGEKTDHIETLIIQDADRMEALGAIGVARIIYYFGERGFAIYNSKPVPETDVVWLNHSLLDQIRRDTMKKWENMNFEISKTISKDRQDFLIVYFNKLKEELYSHHKGDK